jgi:hypothetical protein
MVAQSARTGSRELHGGKLAIRENSTMPRRWLAVVASVVAFVAVVATAWVLFRDRRASTADSGGPRKQAAAERSDGRDATEELLPPERAEDPNEDGAESKPLAASDLEEALARAGIVTTPGAVDGLEVALVGRIDRAPRPDVPVLVFPGDRPRATEVWKSRLDPNWLRRQHARVLRSGADGNVRVELPVRGALLVAEQEGERGVLFVPSGTTAPATLELGVPLELPVRVVDGSGAGRGGVAVAIAKRGRSLAERGGARATTDEAGLATLRDLDVELDGRATTGRFWVGLAFPTSDALGRDVDLSSPAPVELVLPPTGALALQVVAPDGTPLPDAGGAELRVRSARGAAQTLRDRDVPFLVAIAADGTATVANVGLGLHFEIAAKLAGHQPTSVEADGPTRPDERVAIALPAGGAGPIAHGRAVDREKRPIADVDLVAELVARDAGAAATKAPAHTDDDGRFTFDLSGADRRARAGPSALSIARRAAHGAPAAGARIDLASLGDSVDVGDVVVLELPLLCSGHVVDDRAEAVGGATVELVPAARSDPSATAPPAAPGELCRSRADGRFELRGEVPRDPASLKASRRGYASGPPVGFELGAQGLELVLPRAGALIGSLRLPEGVTSHAFTTQMRRVDGDGASTDFDESTRIGKDGGFRFDDLAEGTYDVRIRLRHALGDAAARVVVDGVAVRSGETTRDERLADIDVGRRMRLLVVEVRDAQGSAVAPGTVATVADGSLPRKEVRLIDGRALLAAPAEAFDVEVIAPGFRSLRVAAHPGPLSVVLERGGLIVHVVAPLDHPHDAGLVLYRVKLTPAGFGAVKHALATTVRLGPSGEADAVVPLAGKYVATLDYRRRDAVGGDRKRVAGAELEVACEVLDRTEPQTIALLPPK